MLDEWGTTEKPIMDPAIGAVLSKNMSDVLAIEQAIGFAKAIALWPRVDAIITTYKTTNSATETIARSTGDILAIEQGLGGLKTILPLTPHFLAIWETYNAAKAAEAQPKKP